MKTAKIIRVAISAIINGLIAGIGATLALFTSLEPGATLQQVGQIPLLIAAGTGLLTALKDAQAALKNFEG